MLDENNDGKMAKYYSRCENGGNKHTFDEYGLCFECNKTREQVEREGIEHAFLSMFNAKSARLLFDDQDFGLQGVVEITSHEGNVLHIGILEKR